MLKEFAHSLYEEYKKVLKETESQIQSEDLPEHQSETDKKNETGEIPFKNKVHFCHPPKMQPPSQPPTKYVEYAA